MKLKKIFLFKWFGFKSVAFNLKQKFKRKKKRKNFFAPSKQLRTLINLLQEVKKERLVIALFQVDPIHWNFKDALQSNVCFSLSILFTFLENAFIHHQITLSLNWKHLYVTQKQTNERTQSFVYNRTTFFIPKSLQTDFSCSN